NQIEQKKTDLKERQKENPQQSWTRNKDNQTSQVQLTQFPNRAWWSKAGAWVATSGLLLYSIFAPHSIAAGEISLAIAGAGWFVRALVTRRTGFRRTPFDLPVWLFFIWTIVSSFLFVEPQVSIA